MIKTCSKCKIEKDFSCFNKIKSRKIGIYASCKECCKIYQKVYRKNNKDIAKIYQKIYRKNNEYNYNRDKRNEYFRKYSKNRKKTDINFKISGNLRRRLYDVFKNNYKSIKTIELLGCSIEELKQWIESQFTEGMNWDNYGYKGWHIDHIYPCSKFNLTHSYEQKICFNWFNLQPLWKIDNLKKGNKI